MCDLYDYHDDQYRFDSDGYDADGYDANGRDREGLCADGFDIQGYSASTGKRSRYHDVGWLNGETLAVREWGQGDKLLSTRLSEENEQFSYWSPAVSGDGKAGCKTQREAKQALALAYEQYIEEVKGRLNALTEKPSRVIA